jgi:tetratricopeptide (TPR) repeat protein
MSGRSSTVSKPRNHSAAPAAGKGGVRLYTLEVVLAEGPVGEEFLEQNPDVSRTIEIRGDQTLEDLHEAVLAAFDRTDDQLFAFYLGAGRKADGKPLVPAESVASLNLRVGRRLRYHFDLDDDWTHDVKVTAVGDPAAGVRYPKVIRRVGQSPPQYGEKAGAAKAEAPDLPGAAADVSLLIGEMHLKNGEYARAVAAFTRSIEANPKAADEYEGRARAYRALAAEDERRAREVRGAAAE